MTYPKQLFKAGGPYGHGKRSYSVAGAADAEQEAALRQKGWFGSVSEAYGEKQANAVIAAAEALEDAIDEVSPPTRKEMETKARELGVSFNKRTADEVLAARIAEAID